MKNIINIIKKNWRLLFVSYIFVYLPWFVSLENTITPKAPVIHIMHSAMDDLIPFCEYFIIPYFIWFAYIAAACLFMYFKGSDSEYTRLALSLIIGMSISLFICMIYPNGVNLRPASFERDNIFVRIVQVLYATDTPTNVFPSIHVYNSLAIHIALSKSAALENKRLIKNISLITCISICASTLFLKQHSFTDLVGACILMIVLYIILYFIPDYRKMSARDNVHEHVIES